MNKNIISAVVIDNGSDNLEKCLKSLVNQSVKPEIILVGGYKTNYDIAYNYADKVIKNVKGMLNARIIGIYKSNGKYILSCDSDTIYDKRYCEVALEYLKEYHWIKAGTVIPITIKGIYDKILSKIEEKVVTPSFSPIVHGHMLAFRKDSFKKLMKLNKRNILNKVTGDRADIPMMTIWNLVPVKSVKEMICYVNFPTYYTKKFLKPWKLIFR